MKPPTARDLLLRWKESSIMERRAIESQLRQRSMPMRLPTEEAIVYALIDWLEDVEKRLAKRKPAAKKKRAEARPKVTSEYDAPMLPPEPDYANVIGNGEAA